MITLESVVKEYRSGAEGVVALAGADLHIAGGESVAIIGPSGSGKSTLLNVMGLMTMPTSGKVRVNGVETTALSAARRARLRNSTIGFVFQNYGLLPELTVWENVELPLVYGGGTGGRQPIMNALDAVGMATYAGRYPSQLSGGQQQRVAIARALVTKAPVILADEPTGALDSKTGTEVLDHLARLHRQGRTLVMVTHSLDVARNCSRVIRVADGRLLSASETA